MTLSDESECLLRELELPLADLEPDDCKSGSRSMGRQRPAGRRVRDRAGAERKSDKSLPRQPRD